MLQVNDILANYLKRSKVYELFRAVRDLTDKTRNKDGTMPIPTSDDLDKLGEIYSEIFGSMVEGFIPGTPKKVSKYGPNKFSMDGTKTYAMQPFLSFLETLKEARSRLADTNNEDQKNEFLQAVDNFKKQTIGVWSDLLKYFSEYEFEIELPTGERVIVGGGYKASNTMNRLGGDTCVSCKSTSEQLDNNK